MLNQIVENVESDESYSNCIIRGYSLSYFKPKINDSDFNRCIIESNLKYKDCNFNRCVFESFIYNNQYIDCKFNNCIFANEQNLDKIDDPYSNLLCEGDIIGYKKAYVKNKDYIKVIVKLLIPAKAKRLNGYSNKCRAEYAKVLEIYNVDGEISKYRTGQSAYDEDTFYVKNRIVKADSFDESREVCSNGIHFFRTFKEAAGYSLS